MQTDVIPVPDSRSNPEQGARELKGERERINRNILEREKGLQKQYEDSRIREAKYNKIYKLIEREGGVCKYLRKKAEEGRKQGG